ncbi:DUF805 domain-containing protein [Thermopetrobacter sp. TC1]|uniref:DUF805 domain-containing protein n=1 Tax=Thermopetrobacter sp. TC1 TaxID=1495045 RepID=UPI000690D4FB|nr:DUF805 domain-containing protein [Thermopetrobacter sp. TC1]
MLKSIFNCFLHALNAWDDYSGRASRKEFWSYVLGSLLAFIAAMIFDLAFSMLLFPDYFALSIVVVVLLNIATIALIVRRLHDIGLSGIWVLILLALSFEYASADGRLTAGFGIWPHFSFSMNGGAQGLWSFMPSIALLLAIVIGLLPSGKKAERYGDQPADCAADAHALSDEKENDEPSEKEATS